MGKHMSGYQKRKRKENDEKLINKSYKGGMDKFVIRREASQVSSGNEYVDPSTLALAIVPYNDSRDGQSETDNIEVEDDHIDVNLNSPPSADVDDSFQSDIFDPRN